MSTEIPNQVRSYAQILHENSASLPVFTPIIVRFVLPIPKEILHNSKLLDKLFIESVIAVQKCLPIANVSQTTIFKSTIQRKKGNLKAITVIIPSFLRNEAREMLTKGITMNGRVIPPYSIHDSSKTDADYPKNLRISFRNMPHCISKEEIIISCGLEAFRLEEIAHQQRRLPNGNLFYTGLARVEAIIANQEEECRLKEWSKHAIQQTFSCNGATFQCYCPSFTVANDLQKTSGMHHEQLSEAPEQMQATEPSIQNENQSDPTASTSKKPVNFEDENLDSTGEIDNIQSDPPAEDLENSSSWDEDSSKSGSSIEKPSSKIQRRSSLEQLTSKTQKRHQPIYYYHRERKTILDEKTTWTTYPEAKSLLDNKQLVPVALVTEEEQRIMFEYFQFGYNGTTIRRYDEFAIIKRKYNVFRMRKYKRIFFVNLRGQVKNAVILDKIL